MIPKKGLVREVFFMVLPKNVTQIGESDSHCKVYVEDYVVSYLKQWNRHGADKQLAVALYGVRKEEGGISYLFLYGAGRVNFIQRENRHLSQAQLQEIERIRRKSFPEYSFLGYRLLNGEMVEGFHIYEQGVCRYIKGYAQFYEKNDCMLQFMLEERQEDVKPETVNQEKYEEVKKRQEERRAQYFPQTKKEKGGGTEKLKKGKLTAAAVFALLCAAGVATLQNGENTDAIQTGGTAVTAGTTIVAEDKLTEAIQKENNRTTPEPTGVSEEAAASEATAVSEELTGVSEEAVLPEVTTMPEMTAAPETTDAPEQSLASEPAPETTAQATPEPTATPVATQTPEPTAAPTPVPVSYTIKSGDTLLGICIRQYGSTARVSEICSLNGIGNPDDIKVGEKILLP